MLTGLGAGSERWWRTNKLGGGGSEDPGNCCNRVRRGCRSQNRRGRNRLGTNSGVSGRAYRAGVVGCGRVLGMRVGRLYRPDHADQGDAEQTHSPNEYAPVCRKPQHAIPIRLFGRVPFMILSIVVVYDKQLDRTQFPSLAS
jgi:hypothetical protein